MSNLFGSKQGLIVPDSYKEQRQEEVKSIKFEDIPKEMKELIFCAGCGSTSFIQAVEHYKVKLDGRTGYIAVPIQVCLNCQKPLPKTP